MHADHCFPGDGGGILFPALESGLGPWRQLHLATSASAMREWDSFGSWKLYGMCQLAPACREPLQATLLTPPSLAQSTHNEGNDVSLGADEHMGTAQRQTLWPAPVQPSEK